jgi:hypothetical protein
VTPVPGARRHIVRSAAALAVLLAAIQLVPVKRTNPPVTAEVVAPDDVKAILRRACYDCHSHETRWPWYSRLAPISWWLVDHVGEGRADLNFSRWPMLDLEAQGEALRDIVQQLEQDKMPLKSYRLGHPEARLDAQAKAVLLDWARAGS